MFIQGDSSQIPPFAPGLSPGGSIQHYAYAAISNIVSNIWMWWDPSDQVLHLSSQQRFPLSETHVCSMSERTRIDAKQQESSYVRWLKKK